MILLQEPSTPIIPLFIRQHLDELLADEYVLMNKTVNLLLCLPIVPEQEVPETVYDELKKNVRDITAFLKAQALSINLSINNLLEKTRLISTPALTGCYAWFQHIIADHHFIIARINEALGSLTNEDYVYPVFEKIKERHCAIISFLENYKHDFKKVNHMTPILS